MLSVFGFFTKNTRCLTYDSARYAMGHMKGFQESSPLLEPDPSRGLARGVELLTLKTPGWKLLNTAAF